MKVFISWSGERSKRIAAILNLWLPSVIQALKPYYSKEDIPKGRRWSPELAKELEQSQVGIIVLTPENLHSTFIHFEAGALSKNREAGRVWTILFDVKETDVESPLSDFQNTKFIHDDVLQLVCDINMLLGDNKLEEKVLSNIFEKMWPDFEKEIATIITSKTSTPKPSREQKEIVEEILEHVRKISSKLNNSIPWAIGSSAVDSYNTIPLGKSVNVIDTRNMLPGTVFYNDPSKVFVSRHVNDPFTVNIPDTKTGKSLGENSDNKINP